MIGVLNDFIISDVDLTPGLEKWGDITMVTTYGGM
jgi:hypothetical protein